MNIAYNMGCMEYMRSLPDKAFDLAVVDPPYGIGMDGGNVGYKGFNNFEKKEWDKHIPEKIYFELQEERFNKHSSQCSLFVEPEQLSLTE